jgi:hypothetical protein
MSKISNPVNEEAKISNPANEEAKKQSNEGTPTNNAAKISRPGRSINRTERRSRAERGSQQERAANAENGNERMWQHGVGTSSLRPILFARPVKEGFSNKL